MKTLSSKVLFAVVLFVFFANTSLIAYAGAGGDAVYISDTDLSASKVLDDEVDPEIELDSLEKTEMEDMDAEGEEALEGEAEEGMEEEGVELEADLADLSATVLGEVVEGGEMEDGEVRATEGDEVEEASEEMLEDESSEEEMAVSNFVKEYPVRSVTIVIFVLVVLGLLLRRKKK